LISGERSDEESLGIYHLIPPFFQLQIPHCVRNDSGKGVRNESGKGVRNDSGSETGFLAALRMTARKGIRNDTEEKSPPYMVIGDTVLCGVPSLCSG
jgi:hypothetical protein